jgi:MarR family transcriptional regulator, 2-MHQ and catechol-resistance regulon repressor
MALDSCPSADERVRLFGLLTETNARLARRIGSALESECGLPLAWFEVLLQLRRAPEGRLTMRQIAEGAVYSSGGTTRLVDRIESAGLVERRNCPNDRRAVHVAITAAGDARLDDALTAHLGHLEVGMSERLTGEERATLAALLQKLNAD